MSSQCLDDDADDVSFFSSFFCNLFLIAKKLSAKMEMG